MSDCRTCKSHLHNTKEHSWNPKMLRGVERSRMATAYPALAKSHAELVEALERYLGCDGHDDELTEQAQAALAKARALVPEAKR